MLLNNDNPKRKEKKRRESEIKSSELKAIVFQKRREVERKFIDNT